MYMTIVGILEPYIICRIEEVVKVKPHPSKNANATRHSSKVCRTPQWKVSIFPVRHLAPIEFFTIPRFSTASRFTSDGVVFCSRNKWMFLRISNSLNTSPNYHARTNKSLKQIFDRCLHPLFRFRRPVNTLGRSLHHGVAQTDRWSPTCLIWCSPPIIIWRIAYLCSTQKITGGDLIHVEYNPNIITCHPPLFPLLQYHLSHHMLPFHCTCFDLVHVLIDIHGSSILTRRSIDTTLQYFQIFRSRCKS
mmetsp:Transcript_11749/g.18231  ORF Transcript_11749/g.18231 Transcript_11749/m.18231 type:complete len:248 (+) Transcript_11749:442-1185(+)